MDYRTVHPSFRSFSRAHHPTTTLASSHRLDPRGAEPGTAEASTAQTLRPRRTSCLVAWGGRWFRRLSGDGFAGFRKRRAAQPWEKGEVIR